MPLTIARLRQGILILAALLVAVLIGFFVYARYRLHRFEKDLPGRLGVNIEQTASGYTYSQSSKGHTLYTIHASKLVQYKQGGNAALHDVAITLYGPDGSNRVDKIYGSDFSYNAKDQIVTAQGTVAIDLQGFGNDGHPPSAQDAIHVKTSGLIFNQKTAQADTSQYTEFSFPKASGSSIGAHYNSRTGVLVLDSQVRIATSQNGYPAIVRASHAQVERNSSQALLLNPRTQYKSEQGSADSAIISFRPDGSAQSINAQGNVRIVDADGSVISASSSRTQLNDQSRPLQTEMTGGVSFASNSADESMRGTAGFGTLTFTANSILQHATFRNAVRFVDQVSKLANDPRGSASRQIQASQLDVDFAPVPQSRKAVPSRATATGNAQLDLHTIPSSGPPQATSIGGDQLIALLTPDGKAVRQLNGAGHTKITNLASDGSTSTSSGDRLAVTFAAQPASSRAVKGHSRKARGTAPSFQIASAVQDGNIILTQRAQPKPGSTLPPPTLTAWAQHAEYHGSDQVLRLTGNPRLADGPSLQLAASQIDYHRDSGDAQAVGSVKATYAQQNGPSPVPSPTFGGTGPVHITADHALLRRQGNVSTFHGGSGPDAANARMWQDGDSVSAPVLELTRAPQTLKAYGFPGSSEPQVQANLLSTPGAADGHPGVIRVRSRTFFYSDSDRRGDFRGSVVAQNAGGAIHADQAQIYLLPAASKSDGRQELRQGQLDRVVATGHVVLIQPGRRGTGEKLVYTARSGSYVLTGAPGNPPRIEDAAKGTTTGATLIFNSQDDSVVVSGGQSSAVTETRAPK